MLNCKTFCSRWGKQRLKSSFLWPVVRPHQRANVFIAVPNPHSWRKGDKAACHAEGWSFNEQWHKFSLLEDIYSVALRSSHENNGVKNEPQREVYTLLPFSPWHTCSKYECYLVKLQKLSGTILIWKCLWGGLKLFHLLICTDAISDRDQSFRCPQSTFQVNNENCKVEA